MSAFLGRNVNPNYITKFFVFFRGSKKVMPPPVHKHVPDRLKSRLNLEETVLKL